MCAQYWTLLAKVQAPCGHVVSELQTHWVGEEIGLEYRTIGRLIHRSMAQFTGRLSDEGEDFIGVCQPCDVVFNCDAEIEDGRVVRVLSPVPA